MRIALDIMGGDNAPQAIINGGIDAAKKFPDVHIIMVGTEEALQTLPSLPENISTELCGSVMGMDEAVDNLMKKKDSSIFVATKLVKDGLADAVVSAGSTGAQMAAAVLLLGRVKGVKRPAIATVLPSASGPRVILDMGANPDADAEMLGQFGVMGKIFAKTVLGYENPRIGLLSNGTEEAKGNKTVIEAHQLLKNNAELNFIGNIEGRSIIAGDNYDVVVCDGFTGNVVVKSVEGTAMSLFGIIKKELAASLKTKIGALLVRDNLRNVKKLLDYSEHGGAPLLGVKGISIICHGSSNAYAIMNACRAARNCYEQGFVAQLGTAFAKKED